MVMPKEHGTHTTLFNQFFTNKFIKRKSRQFLRKRHHQEFQTEAFHKFTLFLGGGQKQGITRFTEHVVRMGLKANDGGHKTIHLSNGLQGTEQNYTIKNVC